MAWLALGLACPLAAPSPVRAQAHQDEAPATRAEEAAARRRAAAATTRPHVAPRAEAIINYIEDSRIATRLFDPPSGVMALMGGMAEGNGLSAGMGYRLQAGRSIANLQALGSMRGSYLLRADWTLPLDTADRTFASGRITHGNEAQLRYAGLGARSEAADRIGYALQSTRAEGIFGIRLSPTISATASLGLLRPSLGTSADPGSPVLANRFAEETAPGLIDQPTFFVAETGLVVDRRDAINARRGGLYRLDVRRFADRDTGVYSFTSTRVELQQFIPFWNEARVLALRAVAEQNDADTGATVPFYLSPTLGGSRTLRGFERQRFRDASALLLQAEYRYEVNAFLMGALFVDAGQVAPSLRDVRRRDLQTDYGVGIRFGYATGVALRTDVAFGGDAGARVVLTFSAPF